MKRHHFEDDQSDTNLEVLQENLTSPSHQKDDDDQYLLDSQNYRIVTGFKKMIKMTATNSNSAEFVKEDESVFIFPVNELSRSPR